MSIPTTFPWFLSNISSIHINHEICIIFNHHFTLIFSLASFLNQSVITSHLLLLFMVKVPFPPSSNSTDTIFVEFTLQYLLNDSSRFGFQPFIIEISTLFEFFSFIFFSSFTLFSNGWFSFFSSLDGGSSFFSLDENTRDSTTSMLYGV